MLKYKGSRNPKDSIDVKVEVSDDNRSETLTHIVRHSPCGIDWGYEGAGPSDLALSILVDYLKRKTKFTEEKAKKAVSRIYIKFKDEFVSKFKDEWELQESKIYYFLKNNSDMEGEK